MPKIKPAPLTEEQHAALRDYARRHGPRWKDALRMAWVYAAEPGVLQQLRNMRSFGPRGLDAYRLEDQP